VTSLNVELGRREVSMKEVEAKLLKHFAEVFEAEII
jgi:lipoyl(octanoyl) transferase